MRYQSIQTVSICEKVVKLDVDQIFNRLTQYDGLALARGAPVSSADSNATRIFKRNATARNCGSASQGPSQRRDGQFSAHERIAIFNGRKFDGARVLKSKRARRRPRRLAGFEINSETASCNLQRVSR